MTDFAGQKIVDGARKTQIKEALLEAFAGNLARHVEDMGL